MKCAMELMTTAAVRAEELAREKAERAKREEEERVKCAKREAEANIKETLILCEKIGAEFEKQANAGEKYLIYTVKCDKYYRPLAEGTKYADGSQSYFTFGKALNLKIMANWFANYCFEIKLYKSSYREYGCGYRDGYEVVITPAPSCIN